MDFPAGPLWHNFDWSAELAFDQRNIVHEKTPIELDEIWPKVAINYLHYFLVSLMTDWAKLQKLVLYESKFIRTNFSSSSPSFRKSETEDGDLIEQLEYFDETKVNDEEQFSVPQGVDLNNPVDVFNTIFEQVRPIR